MSSRDWVIFPKWKLTLNWLSAYSRWMPIHLSQFWFFLQTLLLPIWQRLNSAARSRVHPQDNNLSFDNGARGRWRCWSWWLQANQIIPEKLGKLPPLTITFHMALVVNVSKIFVTIIIRTMQAVMTMIMMIMFTTMKTRSEKGCLPQHEMNDHWMVGGLYHSSTNQTRLLTRQPALMILAVTAEMTVIAMMMTKL